jgi:hypothetical protein
MRKWSVVGDQWLGVNDLKKSVFICLFLWLLIPVSAQNKPCQFDERSLQFVGKPIEQARCLLRPNKVGGVLGDKLKTLPYPLEKLIGENVKIKKEKLRKYLQTNQITEEMLGGNLDQPLALTKLPTGEEIETLYFLIHDTSTPNYEEKDFPPEINERSWRFNNLEMWLRNPVAHIFVNRLGKSITTTPFNEPVAKGFGTKFARDFLKTQARGMQIHIELVQPRRSDVTKFNGNDLFAPEMGFTDAQYERLALLYVCASVRRKTWLIPAYHSAMDAGIKDAHDDPQNFVLENFAQMVKKLVRQL